MICKYLVMMKRLVAILISCLTFLNGSGDVLRWQIDSSSFVNNIDMYSFISSLPEDDDNWAVGRVKVTSGSGVVTYIDILDPGADINSPGTSYSGVEGIFLGGNGEFYGAEQA